MTFTDSTHGMASDDIWHSFGLLEREIREKYFSCVNMSTVLLANILKTLF